MDKSIFEYTDYRDYLKNHLSRDHGGKHGTRTALAHAIPCQVSYLSRILNGEAELSLEQAESTNHFFNHDKDEAHYFFLLLQHARAGTVGLKKYFQEMITQILSDRNLLKKRTGIHASLTLEHQSIYYSSWHYAAVHVMSGIPALQTVKAMNERLRIGIPELLNVLKFLDEVGLVEFNPKAQTLKTGLGKIHLGKDSLMILQHHTNWRLQSLRSLEAKRPENLHYSVIVNVSKEDGQKLESMISKLVEDFWKVVHPSRDEETYVFNMDFFRPKF